MNKKKIWYFDSDKIYIIYKILSFSQKVGKYKQIL